MGLVICGKADIGKTTPHTHCEVIIMCDEANIYNVNCITLTV